MTEAQNISQGGEKNTAVESQMRSLIQEEIKGYFNSEEGKKFKRTISAETFFRLNIKETLAVLAVVAGILYGYYDLKSTDAANKETLSKVDATLKEISKKLDRQTIILETALIQSDTLRKAVDARVKAAETSGQNP